MNNHIETINEETNDSKKAEGLLDVFQEGTSISSNADEADLEDAFPAGYDDDEFPAGYDDDCQYVNEDDDGYLEKNDSYPEENGNYQKDNTPKAGKIGLNKLVKLMLDPAVQEYIAKTEDNCCIFITLCETTQKAITYTILQNNQI